MKKPDILLIKTGNILKAVFAGNFSILLYYLVFFFASAGEINGALLIYVMLWTAATSIYYWPNFIFFGILLNIFNCRAGQKKIPVLAIALLSGTGCVLTTWGWFILTGDQRTGHMFRNVAPAVFLSGIVSMGSLCYFMNKPIPPSANSRMDGV
ncbi:hypothetical protein OH491_25280 [Termitidicoccus mucosus]|uniref:hypothetical protein n=1 Tax=Termitidicoccus mucosus TaxID=1184151 RepID=UPI003182D1A7